MQDMPPQQEEVDIDVSDDELEQFVEAFMAASQIQQEAQMEMMEAIEDEGMSVEKYNEIVEGQQMGQQQEDMEEVSEEDMELFESLQETLEVIQAEVEDDIIEAIEDTGMDMERFQEIEMAARTDEEIQQKLQQLIQEQQQQMGPPQQQQQQY